jgi:copper(I)-binding protein
VAALLCAPALAACASGTDSMTNRARTTTNTANGAVGTIDLRNVYVAGPVRSGGDAQVISALFNGGSEADQLVSVSSPDASGGGPGSPANLPPAGGQIYIANGSAPTLTGLKKDLPVGSATKVTFTFAKAGSVTLDVPVEEPLPGASAEPTATPSASASPTTTPTATTTGSPSPGATGSPTAGTTTTPAAVTTATTATATAAAG